MDELIARLTQLACMDRSSDTPVTERAKEAMIEAAASITTLRNELAEARRLLENARQIERNVQAAREHEFKRAEAAEKELAEARRERDEALEQAGLATRDYLDRLQAAERLQFLIYDCSDYLKDGETPRQRMDRDHADILALMKLLSDAKLKAEAAARTARETAIREAMVVAARHRSKLQINEPLWHEGQDWAADRIEQAILALLDSPLPSSSVDDRISPPAGSKTHEAIIRPRTEGHQP